MPSSTSSSSGASARSSSGASARAADPRRLLRASVGALLLLLGLAVALRASTGTSRGLPEGTFWATKVGWVGVADVVLAGDSRVAHGLAPAPLARAMGGDPRLVNFGFRGAGLAEPYLSAAAAVLDPGSARRLLVLGLSAYSLSDAAAEQNGYLEWSSRGASNRFQRVRALGWLLHALRPIDRHDIAFAAAALPAAWLETSLGEKLPRIYVNRYHADGWIESEEAVANPEGGLRKYRSILESSPVSERRVTELLDTIREWRDAGIQVCVVRVPTSPPMERLEAEVAGFDERDLRARLEAAGARWVSAPVDGLFAFDASHLDARSAELWSQRLGAALR